jgi:heterokaryon incompatibility protein (HET)
LGLTPLWIDSICIIRDDESDWETEPSNIVAICQNAHLTIAASMSNHSGISFLTERSNDISKTLTLEYPSEFKDIAIIKARQTLECGLHYQEGFSSRDCKEPLDNRAWTLHEQILSTRIILFTKGEVQWACNNDLACECKGTYM